MSDDELCTLQCVSGGRLSMLQPLVKGSHLATRIDVQRVERTLAQTAEVQPSQQNVLQYIRCLQPASYPGDPFVTTSVDMKHVVAYIKAHLNTVITKPEAMIAQMVDNGILRFSALRYGGVDEVQIGLPVFVFGKPSCLFFSYAWAEKSALESIELLADSLQALNIPVILDRERQNEVVVAGGFNFMVDQVETSDVVVMFVTEKYVTHSKAPLFVDGKQLSQEQINKMTVAELKQIPHTPDHNAVAWEVLLLGRRAAAGKRIVRILAPGISHEDAPLPSAQTLSLVASASKHIVDCAQAAFHALLLVSRTHQLQGTGSKVTATNAALFASLYSSTELVITGDGASVLSVNEVQTALNNANTAMYPLTSDTMIVQTASREDVQKVLGGQDSLRVQVPGHASPFEVKPVC
eukprot:TRINITY_DN2438_c0_g1_i1.p1 TRINITY_DN2438_c0_g1~~TRINITY_DN2438_c0_g1_i1.p1  ORF type:complete len:408 (-),score=81.53 TRINITY_DN2438_c0_g1_i1:45-1268(-)